MENINNKYRNIIERAFLAGIITEENKHIFLSSLREENDSELSEIESLLNIEKGRNFYSYYKSENEDDNNIDLTNPGKNTGISNQTKKEIFDNDYIKSVLLGSTIENYSVLDIKSSKYMSDITDGSTSDASSIRQQNATLKSTHNTKPRSILSKVVKKPMKDQIIDFNVPIYMNLKKKESTSKSHALDSVHIAEHEISNADSGKAGKLKLKASEKGQNNSKWTFSKAKMSDEKKQVIPSKNVTTFTDASTSTECSDESHVEHCESECSTKDKTVEGKEFSFLTEKTLKKQRENPVLTSKSTQTECDKTAEEYNCQTYTINARRKLKFRDNKANTRQSHERNKSSSIEPEFHEQLGSKKDEINKHICMPSKIDKFKVCKRHCNCKSDYTKVLNDTKTAKSRNGDMVSLQGISREIKSNDPERFLNVNIICKFYDGGDDDSVIKDENIQDSQATSDASETTMDEKKTFEEHPSENEKAKKNNKIQCLLKVFASMVNKKKRGPESYPNL